MLNRSIFFGILTLLFTNFSYAENPPIVVVIASYNNENWHEQNLSSIFEQKYDNYRIIYINDASPDRTGELVEKSINAFTDDYQVVTFDSSPEEDIQTATENFKKLVNNNSNFFTLVNNTHRHGSPLSNHYRAISSCQDHEIIALIDGDDWLKHDHVLQQIGDFYASGNVWFTHGKLIEHPHNKVGWSMKAPPEIVKKNAFRKYRMPSHLKTFYTGLFKKVRLEDLLYKGSFCPMAGDMALVFPMIEMAGERHAFSEEINYVYNMANGINENKVNAQLQRDVDAHISALPPYQRLENLEFIKSSNSE
jgi:glycosyltransferase involved in cell wall biosynthesis